MQNFARLCSLQDATKLLLCQISGEVGDGNKGLPHTVARRKSVANVRLSCVGLDCACAKLNRARFCTQKTFSMRRNVVTSHSFPACNPAWGSSAHINFGLSRSIYRTVGHQSGQPDTLFYTLCCLSYQRSFPPYASRSFRLRALPRLGRRRSKSLANLVACAEHSSLDQLIVPGPLNGPSLHSYSGVSSHAVFPRASSWHLLPPVTWKAISSRPSFRIRGFAAMSFVQLIERVQ
jgi:hypothetical protein